MRKSKALAAYNTLVCMRRPTPFQQAMLNALWAKQGEVVTRAALWRAGFGTKPFNQTSFETQMCLLRKTLRPGWTIALVAYTRYTLLAPGQVYEPCEQDALSPMTFALYKTIKANTGLRGADLGRLLNRRPTAIRVLVGAANQKLAPYGLRLKSGPNGYQLRDSV